MTAAATLPVALAERLPLVAQGICDRANALIEQDQAPAYETGARDSDIALGVILVAQVETLKEQERHGLASVKFEQVACALYALIDMPSEDNGGRLCVREGREGDGLARSRGGA